MRYVPRLYLKQFRNPFVVFDKKTGETFLTTPKNIALETGFYDLDPGFRSRSRRVVERALVR